MGKEKQPLTAGQANRCQMRATREEGQKRLRERDAREAQDPRTELQKFMGEPMPSLSALAKAKPPKPKYKPTAEDAAYAGLFALLVSDRLQRLAKVSRTRVRLNKRD